MFRLTIRAKFKGLLCLIAGGVLLSALMAFVGYHAASNVFFSAARLSQQGLAIEAALRGVEIRDEEALGDIRDEMTDVRVRVNNLAPEAVARAAAAARARPARFGSDMDELRLSLARLGKAAGQSMTEGRADAEKALKAARLRIGLLGGFGLLVLAGAASIFGRGIITPLNAVQDVSARLAEGDLTVRLDEGDGELGEIARNFNLAVERLRADMLSIKRSAQSLTGAAEEMRTLSRKLGSAAAESSGQAATISSAAKEVSNNSQTVAAGSEEMGASIREIAKNAGEGSRVAAEAVLSAQRANATVTKLGESSAEIGGVLKTINAIARQTNLLALNAAIEAARAGEAGKGFAVVANEVKELAKQTARATEDIGRRVTAIQGDTKAAVGAISQIGDVIKRINDLQVSTAGAVEEQTATTGEIGRNLAGVAQASGEIARGISDLAKSVKEAATSADGASRASGELFRMAGEFNVLSGRFRC